MIYFVKKIGVDIVMIIFKYRCIDLEIVDENQVAGFLVELGDQWDDLMIYEVNRKEEVLHKNSKSIIPFILLLPFLLQMLCILYHHSL